MREITVRGRAKINLSLDVLGRRDDGYHNVKMVMQQVNLYDEITIKEIDEQIILESNCEFIPTDQRNIAYKAVELIRNRYNIEKGVSIYINKQIPVAAGLAGGSTDAAAVLIGLNKLWNLGATKDELMEMSLPLGADVPFCILGGAALAEGIGEKLTPIEGLEHVWVVLCKPNMCVSTAQVYKNLKLEKIEEHPKTEMIVQALKNKELQGVTGNLCNVLESVTENMYPLVGHIKRKMLEYHALGSLMSGSGPTVFGLYKDYNKAKRAFGKLNRIYKQTYLIKTYTGGESK